MPSLSEKLKSLGVKVGARELPSPPPRNPHSIEHAIKGRTLATAFGDAFVVESVFSADYRHGRAGVQLTASLQTIAEWASDARLAACGPDDFLFLDTETTGLAGGTGTFAFLIGIGRFHGDVLRMTQIFMRDPVEEPAALAALLEHVQPCAALVTFNGRAFDVPLLNARYITNGSPTPLPALAHLDLLPLARRLWRERLPSRALRALEVDILGAQRTDEDVPGWLIPQMYFDYLRNGDARPLRRVFYHNAMDVVAMAALLNHIAQAINDPLVFVEHGLDLIALAKLFDDMGRPDDAVRMYSSALERELPEVSYRDTMQRLAQMHRRRGAWATAVELWLAAAQTRQIYAIVELAKYYEHHERDYAEAARWTRDGLAILAAPQTPARVRMAWQHDLHHRLARLEKKNQR